MAQAPPSSDYATKATEDGLAPDDRDVEGASDSAEVEGRVAGEGGWEQHLEERTVDLRAAAADWPGRRYLRE
jgi:hypothetical protein